MNKMKTVFHAILAGFITLLLATPSLEAAVLEGDKTVYLVTGAGEEVPVGSVSFRPDGDTTTYALKIDSDKFSEHFLSMRPFNCIEGGTQTVCYLPYPHKLRRQVTPQDMTDLEYELLFLYKAAGEYGINFWNGIYYDLALMPDGAIRGTLKETDMNELASPPAEDYGRLIGPENLTAIDGAKHRFPSLIIR